MPQPSVKMPKPDSLRRLLLIWLAVVGIVVLARLGTAGSTDSTLTYTQLREQMAAKNVTEVEITPRSQELRGHLSHPITIAEREVTEFKTVLPFEDPAPLVSDLTAQGVAISAKASGTSFFSYVLSAIPWLILIAFWLFVLRRMQPGSQQALAFGRSGAHPMKGDTPLVTFADVAGADEAKMELQEIIEFLKDPARFRRLGGRLPKGVLLVGPPGTGKTLLAKAVAGEASVPFFSISGSDFVEMFVGVGAARVRDLFQKGKQNAPSIIFIDELDAVGRQRGTGLGGGHDEREQTLNQLLVELDGFETNEGVILLSATNRPDVLDPALLRPGRFDRQIVVDLPDVRAREQILEVHTRMIPLAREVDLSAIARGTPGLAGADLANMANEAALLAARRDEAQVTQQDLEDAKDKVMLGIERRSLVLTEEERRLAAYHEAGHTLATLLMPGVDPIHKVTIVPRGRALGITFALPEADRRNYTKEYLLGKIAVAYGGRLAEEIVMGPDKITTGAAQDYQQASDLARRMVTEFGMSDALGPITVGESDEQVFLGRTLVKQRTISEHMAQIIDAEVDRISRAAYRMARGILERNRENLDILADALLEHETLDAAAIDRLVGDRLVRGEDGNGQKSRVPTQLSRWPLVRRSVGTR
jgi:cell division protease FtsH